MLVGLFSIVMQSMPSTINIEYKECRGFKGNLLPVAIMIILVDLVKIFIFDKALNSNFKGTTFKIFGCEKSIDLTVKNLILIFLTINLFLMLIVYAAI